METHLSVSRRLILRLLIAAGAWMVDGRLVLGTRRGRLGESEAFASCLTSPESAVAIGDAYLRQHPSERDSGLLVTALKARITRSDPTLSWRPIKMASRATLRRAMRRAAATELAAGDFVVLDGWILSRTEALLCALARCSGSEPL